MLFFNFHSMVHDKTGPDRKKLDRRNARQQPIKFKDSGFRTGKMLKKKINEVILTCQCFCLFFWRKLFKYTERNNHLNFLFHYRMFCHARSRENMARPVNLHGRPLDRCTIFGSVPQRNARIMNPKNPDLDLI